VAAPPDVVAALEAAAVDEVVKDQIFSDALYTVLPCNKSIYPAHVDPSTVD
jgi:hypothetical protein